MAQPKSLANGRGADGHLVVHWNDCGDRMLLGKLDHLECRSLRITEVELQQAAGIQRRESACLFRGNRDFDAQPSRCLQERLSPIGGGR